MTRTALLDRLAGWHGFPVVSVSAPAGYGKTTLLAQWAQHRHPRVAWLSLDDRDNDPAVLLAYLGLALERIGIAEPRTGRSYGTPGIGVADVSRLLPTGTVDPSALIVLDHVEALTNVKCRDMVAELAVRLPAGCQLALSSRHDLPLPVPRLRAQGGLAELGTQDLAMDEAEAHSLLGGAGVTSTATTHALVERTEGWPAGLYLAALTIDAGSSAGSLRAEDGYRFTGDDRFMRDYLRAEFLGRVSRADVLFLTRSSVLDRMCGPLCDVTVGGLRSDRVLDRLERRNLLVIPLDRQGRWYRYHHLFRELLHTELLRREPEVVAELNRRAAGWYETNGMPETAVDYAQRAGDTDRVARLVLRSANPVWVTGRLDTVLRWMEWFAAEGVIERHPAVAVHGALIYALAGRAGDADRWAVAAERSATLAGPGTVLDDGNTLEGTLAYLRALLCLDGPERMGHDARTALEGLAPTSPYRPAMLQSEGLSHLLDGDLERADVFFERARADAVSAGAVPVVPVAMAERGLVAIERDDWAGAIALAEQAMALVADRQFDDYWTSAFVYAWGAHVAAHRGDVAQAQDLVRRAARLRPLLTHALPIVSVQALLELARAYLALADPGGARAALRQIDDICRQRPLLGSLPAQAAALAARVEQLKGEVLGASSLTTAELRLLSLLPSHLTLAEIAERFYVSRNTVKTQAISIYRKLGVSTRGEAIARIHALGIGEGG